MGCLFCRQPGDGQYKPPPKTDFICWRCVMLLSAASQSELNKAHRKALKQNSHDQARAIESFLIERDSHVSETENTGCDMVRTRAVQAVRPTRNRQRQKSAVVELD